MANSAGINLPASPSLPIWDSYGGKLLFAIIFGLVAYAQRHGHLLPEPEEAGWESENENSAQPEPEEIRPNPALVAPPPEPQQFTPERAPYTSPLKPTPVRILNSDKVPENPPTDLKGACVNCGQKLAFAPLMINTIILCPACKRETRLRDAGRYT